MFGCGKLVLQCAHGILWKWVERNLALKDVDAKLSKSKKETKRLNENGEWTSLSLPKERFID